MAVYFIQIGDWGPIKIGVVQALGAGSGKKGQSGTTPGKAVAGRRKNLQTSSPWLLVVRGIAPGDAATEAYFHQQLASARMYGEWFQPTAEVMAFARRHCRPINGTPPNDGTWGLWKLGPDEKHHRLQTVKR